MKILYVNAGLETGGGLFHIVNILRAAKSSKDEYSLLTFADGPVAAAAREAGIEVAVLDKKSRYDPKIVSELRDYITAGEFDVVNTHGARANLFVSLIRKKISAKWVITVHSDPNNDFQGRGIVATIFTKLNLRSIKKADHLMTVTKKLAVQIENELHITRTRITVINNGIFFDSSVEKKLPHDGFNLINVARLVPIKGQDLLLEAVKELSLPDLHLHLVGDGERRDYLRQFVEDNALDNVVTFHGMLPQEQITELYREMDLAVLSSLSEGFPLVLLEAANQAVPLLSTDVGDVREIISSEELGFVAQVNDVTSLKNEILRAYNLPREKLAQIGLNSKEVLSAQFSLARQLDLVNGVYENLVQQVEK